MKIKMPTDYKKFFTLEEAEIAKQIIKTDWVKEEDFLSDAKIAMNLIDEGYRYEILKMELTIEKNRRVWDNYFDGSKNLDIYMRLYIYDGYRSFYDIRIFLSDIYEITGIKHEDEKIKNRIGIWHLVLDRETSSI